MEAELLTAKINDAITISRRANKPKWVGFLTPAEQSIALKTAQDKKALFMFYGGYESAERQYFVALPEWSDTEPPQGIAEALTFTFRECDKLSHRDFLGTLMALGINREAVGDILVQQGKAVVFISSELVNYVQTQISKIGGVGVQITSGFTLPLPTLGTLKSFSSTVASPRLDSVVAALICTSREKAKEIINDALVMTDGTVNQKVTAEVTKGQKITVRGYGKFIIDEIGALTKKGRNILNYSKYV